MAVEKRQKAIEPDQDATGEDGETDQQANETRHPRPMVQPSVEDLSRPNTGYNPSSRAQLSSAVAVPTEGDNSHWIGIVGTWRGVIRAPGCRHRPSQRVGEASGTSGCA